jgi:hypothetical protein
MGRNPEKYLYLTLGIRRGSTLHLRLLEDAEEHNVQLPSLASLRLSEYYEAKMQGGSSAPPPRGRIPTSVAEVDLIENIDAANDEWPK